MKVFLGGTGNGSRWREEIIPLLRIDYFNPVVEDWTEDCMAEERKQRAECDVCLYVITPRMMGLYSIAEAIDDSNKRPDKTVLCVLRSDFGENQFDSVVFVPDQMKSLHQVSNMVINNGGKAFDNLPMVVNYLNALVTPIAKTKYKESKADDRKNTP